MTAFENFINWLVDVGVVDVLLPFLLIFAIVFAIMEKAKILGEERKNIHVVIALIIAALVVVPHVTDSYPPGADVVDIINSALPSVSLVLVAIVALLLLMGIFGVTAATAVSGWVAMFAIITVIWIFGSSAGWWGDWNWIRITFGEDALSIAVVILVFGVLIWWITKSEEKTPGETWMQKFSKMFEKK